MDNNNAIDFLFQIFSLPLKHPLFVLLIKIYYVILYLLIYNILLLISSISNTYLKQVIMQTFNIIIPEPNWVEHGNPKVHKKLVNYTQNKIEI